MLCPAHIIKACWQQLSSQYPWQAQLSTWLIRPPVQQPVVHAMNPCHYMGVFEIWSHKFVARKFILTSMVGPFMKLIMGMGVLLCWVIGTPFYFVVSPQFQYGKSIQWFLLLRDHSNERQPVLKDHFAQYFSYHLYLSWKTTVWRDHNLVIPKGCLWR